jgi:hypothetical protein
VSSERIAALKSVGRSSGPDLPKQAILREREREGERGREREREGERGRESASL